MRRNAVLAACLALAMPLQGCEEQARNLRTVESPVLTFPEEPRADCPESRARYYAECADQRAVVAEALAAARAQNKTVLVEMGAEWCVWCHLLHRHLIGEIFSRFEFTYRDGKTYESEEPEAEADVAAAKALAKYMAANFVLVHIDADDKFGVQPEGGTGWDVLARAGARALFNDWVPMTFAVDGTGALIAEFDSRRAERVDEDRNYRGYDREALLLEATRVRRLAQSPP